MQRLSNDSMSSAAVQIAHSRNKANYPARVNLQRPPGMSTLRVSSTYFNLSLVTSAVVPLYPLATDSAIEHIFSYSSVVSVAVHS